jgi:hypothetical protein
MPCDGVVRALPVGAFSANLIELHVEPSEGRGVTGYAVFVPVP